MKRKTKTGQAVESTSNRVWIELEWSPDPATCEDRARKASIMLAKLGVNYYTGQTIWYHPTRATYNVVIDAAGSYKEMKDHGHWFNLDALGCDLPK